MRKFLAVIVVVALAAALMIPASAAVADGKFVTSNEAPVGAKFALDLNKDFTISLYVTADSYQFASPIVWVGSVNQSPENWIGIWHDFEDHGPTLGSNDADGHRLGVQGKKDTVAGVENLFVTIVVSDGEGTLYYDGVAVANTNDDAFQTTWATVVDDPSELSLPDPTTAEDCAVYLSANAWGDGHANASYDELSIYNRALTADEVAALYAAGGDASAAADGLVGYYKFEGNLNNEVEGGVAGVLSAANVNDPAPADESTETPDDGKQPDEAPETGFATIALAIAAIGSGAYVVSKKKH